MESVSFNSKTDLGSNPQCDLLKLVHLSKLHLPHLQNDTTTYFTELVQVNKEHHDDDTVTSLNSFP